MEQGRIWNQELGERQGLSDPRLYLRAPFMVRRCVEHLPDFVFASAQIGDFHHKGIGGSGLEVVPGRIIRCINDKVRFDGIGGIHDTLQNLDAVHPRECQVQNDQVWLS